MILLLLFLLCVHNCISNTIDILHTLHHDKIVLDGIRYENGRLLKHFYNRNDKDIIMYANSNEIMEIICILNLIDDNQDLIGLFQPSINILHNTIKKWNEIITNLKQNNYIIVRQFNIDIFLPESMQINPGYCNLPNIYDGH